MSRWQRTREGRWWWRVVDERSGWSVAAEIVGWSIAVGAGIATIHTAYRKGWAQVWKNIRGWPRAALRALHLPSRVSKLEKHMVSFAEEVRALRIDYEVAKQLGKADPAHESRIAALEKKAERPPVRTMVTVDRVKWGLNDVPELSGRLVPFCPWCAEAGKETPLDVEQIEGTSDVQLMCVRSAVHGGDVFSASMSARRFQDIESASAVRTQIEKLKSG